jgi:hypothetical protein
VDGGGIPGTLAALERKGEGEARSSRGGKGGVGGAHRREKSGGGGGDSPTIGGGRPSWRCEGEGSGVVSFRKKACDKE